MKHKTMFRILNFLLILFLMLSCGIIMVSSWEVQPTDKDECNFNDICMKYDGCTWHIEPENNTIIIHEDRCKDARFYQIPFTY